MTPAISIINGFCPRIEEVRQSALESGFGTWAPPVGASGHAKYEGMNFHGLHSLMLASILRHTNEVAFPNVSFFRVTGGNGKNSDLVHSDRNDGAKTCIAYMSQHKDAVSATAFYRHKATGWLGMPPVSWMRETQTANLDFPCPQNWFKANVFDNLWADMQNDSPDIWQETHRASGEYNSALIFDAPLFHKRVQSGNFGESDGEKRMVWVSHYHTAETVENQSR